MANELKLRVTGSSDFVDAYTTYGVRMGDGFLDAIQAPLALKDMVENESRLQHGKRIIKGVVKKQSRDLTLTFRVLASNKTQFYQRKRAFFDFLYNSFIDVMIPSISDEVYHLRYIGRNTTYGQNLAQTSCMITAKFEESNPNDRA